MLKRFGMVASVLALLAVALAGCKNGMLGEDEATVNGLRDAGNRTAFVTVTNFAGDGRLRTIAPDTPDVKNGYKFIAEGKSGRNVLEAKVVTIDQATGRVDLADLPPGLWSITLTAYDVNKLGGDTDAAAIVAKKNTAAVLSGTATVDLTRNSGDVLITLTPRNVGTEGTVNLTVVFDANDQREIQNKNKGQYTVTIGLYKRSTGEAVGTSVQDVTVTLEGGQARVPYTGGGNIPVGEYTFKVTITETSGTGKGPWYYTDNLFVHGNMETAQEVTLPELLGGAIPADPSNFAAYWSDSDPTKYNADGSEYTVHFAWNRNSFNESGFKLEIADITDYFNPVARTYDGEVADSATNLWTAIDDKQHGKVITITEKDFSIVTYPIYDKQGSLVAGSTYVDYVLPSGRLYAARICASNDNGDSQWVHLNANTDPASKWQDGGITPAINVTGAKKLNDYYFDVFSVTYQLGNFILLKQGEQAAAAAVKGDVALHAYQQGTPYTVKYDVATSAGDVDKYQLYRASFTGQADFDGTDRVKSWSGWQNVTNRADTKVYKTGTDYTEFTNVTLAPAGASGGLLVDAITAGTFKDLLTDTTVFINLKEETVQTTTPTAPVWQADMAWGRITDSIKTAAQGKKVGTVDNKKGINLPDIIGTEGYYLFVAVGKDKDNLGKLDITTGNGSTRESEVYRMTLTLEKNDTVIVSGVSKPGDTEVFCDVTKLDEGDYTLRLMVTPMEGYDFSFQKQIVVKCESTVIP